MVRRAIRTPRYRIPGGASSGGTGVAVAARIAPGGIGSDTGGSVRIPAALCGIVGLRPTTGRWSQAGIVPISHTRDTAGPMTRSVADCVLLDGVVTGGSTEVAPTALKGMRIGVPRKYFWENLEPELAQICESALLRLTDAGAALSDVDMSEEAAIDGEAGFPIALYETVTDLNKYLAEHGTGMDYAALVAKVASPDVKGIRKASPIGTGAVPEGVYRKALQQRSIMQETYRRHFREHGIAANISDSTGAQMILDGVRKRWPWLKHLFADGAYDRTQLMDKAAFRDFTIQIIKRSDAAVGFEVIPRRWVVERTFAWMTRWRRLVRDYEERIDCSEAMIHVALGSVLLRRIAHE